MLSIGSSHLKTGPTASLLKCSRGANQIALTILDVDQIVFDTYASMIDPSVFVLLNNPAPLFGHIRFYQYDTWMDSGVRKYRPASGDMYVWGLRKRTNGKWFWSGVQPFGDPTPHAVRSIYNPRAWKNNTGDYALYHSFPHMTRLKVYGRTMGTLCQYSGRYYDAEDVTFEDIGGPEDTVMESIAPTGFQRIDQGQGASFTFLPLFPALPPKDDYPAAGQWLGGPALAIYWPGRRPESFPWYLSTGDAVVSEREGPLTTD